MFTPQVFTIQSNAPTADGIGGHKDTWSKVKDVYGYLDLVTGSDNNTIQNAFVEQSTHILIIPTYTDGITDKMRVVDSANRWYSITYVDDPVSQHHHLELYLKFGGVISG